MNPASSIAASIARTMAPDRFESETRAHLRGRLSLVTGAVAAFTGALWIVFLVQQSLREDVGPLGMLRRFLFEFPHSVLSLLVFVAAGLYLVLRLGRPSMRGLVLIDGLFLLTSFVPCVALFHRLPWFSFSGYPMVVPFLVLFILSRAVLVPSRPWLTLLLSAVAPVAILISQIGAGAAYRAPGEPYSSAYHVDMLVQNQVVLWGAVLVATIASRVNLGLRRAGYDARRIGQFDLHELIGRGAMGEVYRATHSLLKRPTAIKMLRPELAGQAALTRFEREVRSTSRLRHPNTVIVYDYGHTADGVFYYAMELLDGANLRDVVDGTGPMPAGRAISILERVCAALSEAHAEGLVHRDVKPENVMLCEQGGEVDVVKLLDFGLVRDLGAHGEFDVAGTPETMAPEVAQGHRPTPVSDLYSVAVVAFYLLSGARLFDGPSVVDVLGQHVSASPDLDRLDAGVPADLRSVLARALHKDPAARFPDTHTMREALLDCAAVPAWTHAEAERWWSEHRNQVIGGKPGVGGPAIAATTIMKPR